MDCANMTASDIEFWRNVAMWAGYIPAFVIAFGVFVFLARRSERIYPKHTSELDGKRRFAETGAVLAGMITFPVVMGIVLSSGFIAENFLCLVP